MGSRYFSCIESLLKQHLHSYLKVSLFIDCALFLLWFMKTWRKSTFCPLITKRITRGPLILFHISVSVHEKYASCFRGLSFCVRGRCDLEPLLLAHYIQWKIWQVFYESVLKVCYFHSPGKLHYTIWQFRLSSFQAGYTKLETFCLKLNIPKENFWILRIGLMGRCQKLGVISESKVI